MIEIERKFLVQDFSFKDQAVACIPIAQGFLSTDPERTVRVRLYKDKGMLTIKGKSNQTGTSRFEWEKPLTKQEALDLLALCLAGVIHKNRYIVPIDGFTYEVDEFLAENTGLCIAEIELTTEDAVFTKPHWLGKEVTGQVQYYNSQLSKKPYTTW